MRFAHVLPVLALPLALVARPALAQGSECPVTIYQPAALAQAAIVVSKATQATVPAEAEKALRDAMRLLQDEKRYASNVVGAGFLKAQLYVLWLHQANVGDSITLEKLGAKGVKTDKIDLLAAADSLLRAVEGVDPSCASETLQWRQAKPWTERINKAYTFLTAEAIDSATYYAGRSRLLHPNSPFVHNLYAQLAGKRDDTPAMLKYLRLAITAAEADTSLGPTTRQLRFQLAGTAHQYAMTGGAAQKDELEKEARDTYVMLLRGMPSGPEAAFAFQGASEIIGLAQDSAAAGELMAPMVADPEPYDDLTLLLAADLARLMQRNTDAITLYESTLRKNPNVRDASYFLSFMYFETKQADKMMPLMDKLLEIDPSNPDNYLMKASALKLLADAEQDAVKKAALTKEMDAFAAQENGMPHKLLVSRFERRAEGAVLAGAVENRGKTERAYTVQVDFLDLEGKVVESMSAEVSVVKPNAMGAFELSPTKPGIVAYRYSALK